MIVMKFGGTSNENAAAMRNVIRIVQSRIDDQPLVVISAVARATNELEQVARTACLGNLTQAEELVASLFRRHDSILLELITSPERISTVKGAFSIYESELNQLVKGLAILKELTPRTMDAVCSYGERLSSRLIAAGLQEAGIEAVWVDAKDFMITDDGFGKAQPLMETVTERLETVVRPMIREGKIPVTQGFIGATRSGAYTTMGRESSDYSASIIGAAMNADLVQIWTDVDGILTADPRMVPSAKKVSHMSFGEAFELSYFGAKVLHPKTMLPMIEKRISLQILNSKREGGTGTMVEVDALHENGVVKSIAHKRNLSVITAAPHRRQGQYVFWEAMFSVFTRHDISVSLMTTSEYRASFLVDNRSVTDSLVHELGDFGTVKVAGGKGCISVVGEGIRENSEIISAVFKALGEAGVCMVSFGASDSSISLVVESERIPAALKRLHHEFFEDSSVSRIFEKVGS